VEARGRGRRARHLGGDVTVRRGSAERTAGNTAPGGTDPTGAQILEAGGDPPVAKPSGVATAGDRNSTEEWHRREAGSATVGGKPLKTPRKLKGVTSTKQGWNGVGRSNASRG